MSTLLSTAVSLLAGIAVLGLCRVWLHLSTNGTDRKLSATLMVDKDTIHADEKLAKDTLQGLGQEVKEKTGDLTEQVKQ